MSVTQPYLTGANISRTSTPPQMSSPILPNERSTRSLSEFELNQDSNSKDSKLGKGSFANVQLALEKKSGNPIAMKIINANLSTASKSEIHNLQTEIKIHRELSHPNIIKFHDYIQEGLNVYIILEYAPNGNLYSFMNKRKHLTPAQIFRFFYQSCLAVQYLHQNDILHRDLKPENLLLDKDLNIKLCDFGWAARSIRDRRTTFCGTYEYMAPEIVDKKTYDYRVDIWSLGVLLYELVHGEAPYKGRSLPEITASFARGPFQFRSPIAADLKDLIQRILQPNPEDRITLNDILSHNWVRKNLEQSNPSSTSTSTRNLDSLRNLIRTQRVPLEADSQYSTATDKENLQGKPVMQHYKEFDSQTSKNEIARALANLGHTSEHFPETRKKIERPDMLPGLLGTKERSHVDTSKIVAYKSLEREYQSQKHVEYGAASLMKTLPGRVGAPEALDSLNEYNKRPKYQDRSMNPKLNYTELDLVSSNMNFDKGEGQGSAPVLKALNQQKAIDLLRKAESTRNNYHFRPNYFEKGGNQPQVAQYSSNIITSQDTRTNFNMTRYPIGLRPNVSNYESRAVQNDHEESNQWKNSTGPLKMETFRTGSQKVPYFEMQTPTSLMFDSNKGLKTGISALRSLPLISYSKSSVESESKMSQSPYHNYNTTSGGWHMGMSTMGGAFSTGSSPMHLNERYQSSK